MPQGYSVDIRGLDKHGITSPCGNCRLFRYVQDAFIWIKEETQHDIPASLPHVGTWNFSKDYVQTI